VKPRSHAAIAPNLGARLRERRLEVGLSQLALAEAAGLSLNFVGSMERGAHLPRLETLATLARVLRTTPSDLLRTDAREGERDAWADELVTLAKRLSPTKREALLIFARALVAHARRRG
jgi:transcriptional regulator with XRE-family HTH domain